MHRHVRSLLGAAVLAAVASACGGGGGSAMPPMQVGGNQPTPAPSTAPTTSPTSAPTTTPSGPLKLPAAFGYSVIATVGNARQLAMLPNGDLLVGTEGSSVAIVPSAEAATPGSPATFTSISDSPVQGVAYGSGYVFVATQHGVYRIAYTSGMQSGSPQQIASVRTGTPTPGSDGDVHTTSSVAISGSTLYVGVGSGCNACAEVDPTRATVQRMGIDGSGMTTQARRWRNPIAMATDPATGNVWAGGAGQDALPFGHPYEFMDPVSTHPTGSDYGWPDCEENDVAYKAGANCSGVVVPQLEFPAYSTIIGAAFYPAGQGGTYAFPAAYRGGLFVSMHGSWHQQNGVDVDPPHVAFVPFAGAAPARPVNWSDPTAQWSDFFTGFQTASGSRLGRTTGIAVGPQGSLFVADDQTGNIYRIRPQ